MTIPRMQAILDYQKRRPPVHVMIAEYLGAGSKSGSDGNLSGVDDNGQSLFDLFPQRG